MVTLIAELEAGWHLLLQSWLMELALGFTFFTALSYAVFIRRFDHPRSVAVMAAALGMALGGGLAAWSHYHGWSIADLGPAAAAVTLLAIVVVVYESFRRLAGHAMAAGTALLVAALIAGMFARSADPLLRSAASLLLLTAMLGGLAWLVLRLGESRVPMRITPTQVQDDLSELRQLRAQTSRLTEQIDELKSDSLWLEREPQLAGQVRKRLEQMLPEQGQLTERLSYLREMMTRARRGEAAKVKLLQKELHRLPENQRAAAVERLRAASREASLTRRLERLDRAVAEAEKRLIELTRGVKAALDQRRFADVNRLMDAAQRLQHQMERLIIRIEKTERTLLHAVRGGGEA